MKQFLQERLSLSSKLFLKEWLANASRAAAYLYRAPVSLARRVLSRARLLRDYQLRMPPAPSIDYTMLEGELDKLTPRQPAQIRASIVIPVFNQAEFTASCLRSLLHVLDLAETEIAVVDNGSTDETEKVLSHFGQFVRVIRNEDNRGFVDACNQGAAAARGKYLVFLNNDTEVRPGWLKHLIDTIESDAEVGAVGSMFLYPDRKIQEAGAFVWKSGEPQHYGWGGSPDDKRFNFAREVDYCSAASLLIRKDLFDQLGGFDRRFAPAYFEDIDLCFGLRSLGYKVIYQPMSRVVHYEGGTAGRDVKKGTKRYQILNRQKFFDKWREVLERDHPEKNLKRIEAAANRKRGPNIVVFDERIPSPDRDAGSARMFTILKTLNQWSKVNFVPFNRPQSVRYEQALWKMGIQTADIVDYRRLLKSRDCAIAIISRPRPAEAMIPRIRRIAPKVKIAFDMVDAYFRRLEREHQISHEQRTLNEARRYRELETRLAKASDLVWCNSSEDKQAMAARLPPKRIEVIPTVHEVRDSGKQFDERENLLFIGNMAHRPNTDGVSYFISEIWPLIESSVPGIVFNIIGDGAPPEIRALDSTQVRLLGYQPDIEPWLHGCRVFVAPLRFGAGTKGKVGDAMSFGLPTVTTSIGAEGFGLTHGVNIMIGDDPKSFADGVVALYTQTELWQKIATNSRRHVEENFTPEVISQTINSSIRDLL